MITMTKKILLVEDEPTYYKVLQKALTDEGFDVTLASEGKQAILILNRETFDLILLDLIMPGLNGFDVLEKVKTLPNWNNAKILVLSNLGQIEEIRRSVAMGAADHIIKANLSLPEVIEKVKVYLNP